MHDDQFREILDYFALSWNGYRRVRKGVKKRIRRHMQQTGYPTVQSYLAALDAHPALKQACDGLLAVSISRFFRDRRMWDCLCDTHLPELVGRSQEPMKVWSAGCACGEEVYSFAILWDKFIQGRSHDTPEMELVATDMNPVLLDKARTGSYPVSSLREVDPLDVSRYFTRAGIRGPFRINDALRRHIAWRQLDIRFQRPEEDYHIIFLRNSILTYYRDPMRTDIFYRVLDRLLPSGLLIIGSHETIPPTESLVPVPPFTYLFRKVSAS